MSKYFNSKGLLGPHPENDILFTAEFWTLINLEGGKIPQELIPKIKASIETLRTGPKSFCSDDPTQVFSHDNMTGLVCLSKLCGFDYHKTVFYKDWQYRLHPRDIIFYVWAAGGVWGFLFNLLLPLSLFLSVLEVEVDSYKNIDGDVVLSTDGKLLTWLRINTFNLPLTKLICDWLIKRRHGSWDKIFAIYFHDVQHPNNVLARKIYSIDK